VLNSKLRTYLIYSYEQGNRHYKTLEIHEFVTITRRIGKTKIYNINKYTNRKIYIGKNNKSIYK